MGNGKASDGVDDLRETVASPKTPHSISIRNRKKNEVLMSTLVQEYHDYGEDPLDDDVQMLSRLYSGEINFDDFDVVKVIGRGSYAKVYLIKKHGLDG